MRTALTIAGSDSGGGAGIQADLRTFAAHDVFGTCAITAITVQNTREIRRVYPLPPPLVVEQMDAVASDLTIDAVKIGMLVDRRTVVAVADALRRMRLPNVVLDPVFQSTSGAVLLDRDGISALKSELLPLVEVVTPNTFEAEALTGLPVRTLDDAMAAAELLRREGARCVVVTGGHLEGPATDVFASEGESRLLTASRIDTVQTHGTGCTFSSAIAARLAHGDRPIDAARTAKDYVRRAILERL